VAGPFVVGAYVFDGIGKLKPFLEAADIGKRKPAL